MIYRQGGSRQECSHRPKSLNSAAAKQAPRTCAAWSRCQDSTANRSPGRLEPLGRTPWLREKEVRFYMPKKYPPEVKRAISEPEEERAPPTSGRRGTRHLSTDRPSVGQPAVAGDQYHQATRRSGSCTRSHLLRRSEARSQPCVRRLLVLLGEVPVPRTGAVAAGSGESVG